MTYLRGCDVSRHQGEIDWPRFAPHVDELLIRSTMGATGVDAAYSRNWRESGWAGIPRRGVYHLVTSETPWRGQRENILRVTGGNLGNAPLTLDVERTAWDRSRMAAGWRFPREQYTDDLMALADGLRAEAACGVRLYSNESEWNVMTTRPMLALGYGFHGAGYPSTATRTHTDLLARLATYRLAVPEPWRHIPDEPQWEAWQGASTGRLPGIAGNVDLSLVRVAVAPVPPADDSAARIAGWARDILAEVA